MKKALLVRRTAAARSLRRDPCWQVDAREAERTVRRSAVAFTRCLLRRENDRGRRIYSVVRVAGLIGISDSTLGEWLRQWREDRMRLEPRGRTLERSDRDTRNALMAALQLLGPGVSIAVMQELFPDVARRELEAFVARYENAYRRRNALLIHALRWTRVGAVWAMDFIQAPSAIEGQYRWVLLVRDLASGVLLWATPVDDCTGLTVRHALRALIVEHGAPLVLKSDNGSGFIDHQTRALIAAHGIAFLLSPPGLPAYNGSCEAGGGSLKTRTHHQAARHDRPGEWTCDDVEAARLQANQTARPHGFNQPVPDDLWAGRVALTDAERRAFLEAVARARPEAHAQLGLLPNITLSERQTDNVERVAIARALVALEYLKFRRRRIAPPITRVTRAKIS